MTPEPAIPPPVAASLGGLYDAWLRQDVPQPPPLRDFASALIADDVVHLPEFVVDTRGGREHRTAPTPPAAAAAATTVTSPPPLPGPGATPVVPGSTTAADVPTGLPADGATPAPAPAEPAGSGGGLMRSSAIMASGTIVSRALGLLRVAMLAAIIGNTSTPSNVWDTANSLPNLIYILLAGGVINAVLVPQIARALSHPDGGKTFTDALLTRALVLLGGVTVILTLGAPFLYRIYDPTTDPDRLHLGIAFSLICLPQLFFYGVYTLLGEVLNARGRFGALMWAPVLANVVSILGLLVLWTMSDPGSLRQVDGWSWPEIIVLAGSATLGIVAQALILIIPLRRSGYRFSINWRFRGLEARTTTRIAGWAFGAVVVQQLGQIVTARVLNPVPQSFGGKAAQSSAFLLFMLPHSIITLSLVTALYTRLSHAAHRDDKPAVVGDFTLGLRLSGISTVAVTVGALVLVGPIATAIIGPANGAAAVADATIAMCLGIVPFTLCVLTQRVFYAFQDAVWPFWMQVICTLVASGCALIASGFAPQYIGAGVALGQSISYVAQAAVGWWLVRRHIGRVRVGAVLNTYGRLFVAAVAATLATAVLFFFTVGIFTPQNPLHSRATGIVAVIIGLPVFALVYVVVAKALRVHEIETLLTRVRSLTGRLTGSA